MPKILVIAGKVIVRLGKIVTTACGLCCGCGWWPANPCNIPSGACGGSGGPIVLYIDGCEPLTVGAVVQIGDRCYRIGAKIPVLPDNGFIVTDYTVVDDCFSPPCPSLGGTHLKSRVCPLFPWQDINDVLDFYVCPECIPACGGFRDGEFCYYFEPGPLVVKPPQATEGVCGPPLPPGAIRFGGRVVTLEQNFKCCQCVPGCIDSVVNNPHPVTGVPLNLRCCCGFAAGSRYVTTYSYYQRINYFLEDPTGGSYSIERAAGTIRITRGTGNDQYIGATDVPGTGEVFLYGSLVQTYNFTVPLPIYACAGFGFPGSVTQMAYGFFPNLGVQGIEPNPGSACVGPVVINIDCHRASGSLSSACFIPQQTQPRVETVITVSYTEVPAGQCTGGCGQASNESKVLAMADGPFNQPLAFGFL